jgi:hypothetical protein
MEKKIHITSSFVTNDAELLKKAVTEKIEKLLNEHIKKNG